MPKSETHRLDFSQIGYKGKPIDTLSKEELLEAFLNLAQTVYECAKQDNPCKNIFLIKSDR